MAEAQGSSVLSGHHDGLRQLTDELTGFETLSYGEHVHSAALALLSRPRYRSGLEIGCMTGELTERLSRRCAALLAIDRSEVALSVARQRCAHLPQVQFQRMRVPEEYPSALFDLTIVSEVGYYWSRDDLRIAQRRIVAHLDFGGHLLLVHRIFQDTSRAHSADATHTAFLDQMPFALHHLASRREPAYRIDLFERI